MCLGSLLNLLNIYSYRDIYILVIDYTRFTDIVAGTVLFNTSNAIHVKLIL